MIETVRMRSVTGLVMRNVIFFVSLGLVVHLCQRQTDFLADFLTYLRDRVVKLDPALPVFARGIPDYLYHHT